MPTTSCRRAGAPLAITRGRARSSADRAVEAGVLAKGRLASTDYTAHMSAWANDPHLALPKPVEVHTNEAAVAQLGPLLVAKTDAGQRAEQLGTALAELFE